MSILNGGFPMVGGGFVGATNLGTGSLLDLDLQSIAMDMNLGGVTNLGIGSLLDLDLQSIAMNMNPPLGVDGFPMVGGGFGGGIAGLGGAESSQPQYVLSVIDEPMADAEAESTEAAPESGVESVDATTNGGSSIAFKTMLEMGIEENSKIPSEPIEKGSFASYNRVLEPIHANCRLALEGDPSEIQSTLQALSDMKEGNQRVTFTTPFDSYENLMLESFDYRRDGNSGFNVLVVDLNLTEIREIESQKTTSSVEEPEPEVTADEAADGSCVSAEDCGEVQTYSPSASESASAESSSSGQKSSTLYDIWN